MQKPNINEICVSDEWRGRALIDERMNLDAEDRQQMSMATITYRQQTPCGSVYRMRIEGVALVRDEPYPPGGMLRVIYDGAGRILAGPPVHEILSWEVA